MLKLAFAIAFQHRSLQAVENSKQAKARSKVEEPSGC